MPSHVYLLFTLAFYAVGALHVLLQALTRRKLLTSWTVTATLIGFALHTASLAQRWTEAGHFPAVGLHDVSSFLGWAIVLVFSGSYSELLDYIIWAALFFYVLTVAGLFVLRRTMPDAERPYRAFGYPVLPAFYMVGATVILVVLAIYRTQTTWPGLLIVLAGVPVYFLWRKSRPAAT